MTRSSTKKKRTGQKSDRKKLKDKLWRLTSEYVRRLHADHNGMTSCVTCGLTKHWKQMQAGHYIPQAQGNAVKYDLRNIHVQCYRCNVNLGGNGPEYCPFMVKTYGHEVVDELRQLSNMTVKFSLADLQDMITDIEKKLEALDEIF